MSKPPLPHEAVAMLEKANPAVITTLRSDGQPVSTATWYLWDDGRVLVNMDEGRKRLQHLRNDPRVTITVLDESSWYTHISIIGRVTEFREDKDLADIDRLAHHYLGDAIRSATAPGSAPGSRSTAGTAGARSRTAARRADVPWAGPPPEFGGGLADVRSCGLIDGQAASWYASRHLIIRRTTSRGITPKTPNDMSSNCQ